MAFTKDDITLELVQRSNSVTNLLRLIDQPVGDYSRVKLKRILIDNNWYDSLNTDYLGKTGVWGSLTYDAFATVVARCTTWTDVAKRLNLGCRGATFNTIKKYVAKYNISTSHFDGRGKQGRMPCTRKENSDLFVADSGSANITIRTRIIQEALLQYVCSECGLDSTWNGKDLTLQLEHKNGIPNDHRLSNLCFICPNCHTQTKTWGRKKRDHN